MSGSEAVSPSVNSWNAEYLEAQYLAWKRDPSAVSHDLRAFFAGFDLGAGRGITLGESAGSGQKAVPAENVDAFRFQSAVSDLIESYRSVGHLCAKTDPFGREPPKPPELTLEDHGLSEADLDRRIATGTTPLPEISTLRDLVAFLDRTYCGSIGLQTAHMTDAQERRWIQSAFERLGGRIQLSRGDKAHILERLIRAEQFEKFLQNRYPGEKRFSLEGGESLIALMDRMIEAAVDLNVQEMVIGMAHRGRLNVLNNVIGKSFEQIFTEFEDAWASLVVGGGDVKYHRGYSGERTLRNGRKIWLAMASNPSHLEAVNGLVLGRCRGKQRLAGDVPGRSRIVPLLIHGDAAVIGQGSVAEALNLSQLQGYTVGGCLHIVVNNLIGFTTGPQDARSTRYCTDIALMLESPVFHVNAEDPEAVVTCGQLAVEYRQRFKKDVFIDLVCYRKYGHNEQDEASFTQPILASLIRAKAQETVLKRYAAQLQTEGVITETDQVAIASRLDETLEAAQRAARTKPYDPTIDPGSRRWSGMGKPYTLDPVPTGVPMAMIEEVCEAMGRVPEGFNLNPKLQRLLTDRAALPKTGSISYADAESIAWGTLLVEGYSVRLSGQDSRRGTFSHRHAVLRDMQTERAFMPLNNIRALAPHADQAGNPGPDGRPMQGHLSVWDSPLSEAAVMAFEYGYSLTDPKLLVCWEAQFGDFANGAQMIIDQFLASAEAKWERWSGLTLLLPHGYEGAGPEHSSARIERFLKLCGENNMQVVYPSTAAQCFHMFRRQLHARYRKPLIVFTPKSLLRVPTSGIDELTRGAFEHLIDDPRYATDKSERKSVTRMLWCTGKVYHELAAKREAIGNASTAIVRIEQLYPFDAARAAEIISRYPSAGEHVWVQEEPRNMGAYLFIADRFRVESDLGVELKYVGRPASAVTAVGSKKVDKKQQEQMLTEAFAGQPSSLSAGDSHVHDSANQNGGAPKAGPAHSKSAAALSASPAAMGRKIKS
ncbi:MAG: 2-oxoglutarate dehydrogenase E1 component [Phycisphaeraceae bacterium]|nr:2-oxoglutarate dehydrogenase E1 component [Phycisphaeraceae bacterium]